MLAPSRLEKSGDTSPHSKSETAMTINVCLARLDSGPGIISIGMTYAGMTEAISSNSGAV